MGLGLAGESGKQRAKELLALPKEKLYPFYINSIASPYVKNKTERGKQACYRLWINELERDARR